MSNSSTEQPYDLEITEQPYALEVVADTYTLTISGLGATGLQGPAGPAGQPGAQGQQGPPGPAGPNSVTSATTSDGTANLNLASASVSWSLTAPTAGTGTNTTTVATTAFVQQELASGTATAKNVEVFCRNNTGATLTKGTIVYINGAIGNRPTITKAQANGDATSAQTIGFVKTDIAHNADGFVITSGDLENVNTGSLTAGQQLYLSPSVAGEWTTTKPSAPNHLVYVGIVVRPNNSVGVIYVAIQNGYELNELHDVAINSPATGQVLRRNAGNTLWVNSALTASDVGAAPTTHTHTSASITDATSSATPNMVVKRDSLGRATFSAVTAGDSTNGVELNSSGIYLSKADEVFTLLPPLSVTAGQDYYLPDASGTIALTNDPRFTDARTPLTHTHGNISNTGTIGSTSGLPLITGTGGVVQTSTFGSTAGTFCQGNDARLSNARTPLPHTHLSADITDATSSGEPNTLALRDENGGLSAASMSAGTFSGLLVQVNDISAVSVESTTIAGVNYVLGGTDQNGVKLNASGIKIYKNGGVSYIQPPTDSTLRYYYLPNADGTFMLGENNLFDLTNQSVARINLGATTTGGALFTAATPAAARSTLGAGTTGSALFTAATPAVARGALEILTSTVPTDSTATLLNTWVSTGASVSLTAGTWRVQAFYHGSNAGSSNTNVRLSASANWADTNGRRVATVTAATIFGGPTYQTGGTSSAVNFGNNAAVAGEIIAIVKMTGNGTLAMEMTNTNSTGTVTCFAGSHIVATRI